MKMRKFTHTIQGSYSSSSPVIWDGCGGGGCGGCGGCGGWAGKARGVPEIEFSSEKQCSDRSDLIWPGRGWGMGEGGRRRGARLERKKSSADIRISGGRSKQDYIKTQSLPPMQLEASLTSGRKATRGDGGDQEKAEPGGNEGLDLAMANYDTCAPSRMASSALDSEREGSYRGL
ncbi:hypothetical protein DFP73DRAFT_524159 [Morchella snyderi]|nr:hypothetical protein DFP73DRAFT_524159 [Morchella snyderi]